MSFGSSLFRTVAGIYREGTSDDFRDRNRAFFQCKVGGNSKGIHWPRGGVATRSGLLSSRGVDGFGDCLSDFFATTSSFDDYRSVCCCEITQKNGNHQISKKKNSKTYVGEVL
ncbi:hypothetical protein NPIL_540271 [Nephila pilipes]|uniref:Uncharacterized protein n=1 Tax=Nephila pilipes TaxID=299642 RepID=A0A8X6TC93_NEPPI|nr:hypothetical protein NPIL_540271 [Nephila pilipes]